MSLIRKGLSACDATPGCGGPPIAVWNNLQGKLIFACRECDRRLTEVAAMEKADRRMRDDNERQVARHSAKELADGILGARKQPERKLA